MSGTPLGFCKCLFRILFFCLCQPCSLSGYTEPECRFESVDRLPSNYCGRWSGSSFSGAITWSENALGLDRGKLRGHTIRLLKYAHVIWQQILLYSKVVCYCTVHPDAGIGEAIHFLSPVRESREYGEMRETIDCSDCTDNVSPSDCYQRADR